MHTEVLMWLNFCKQHIAAIEGDLSKFKVAEIGSRNINGEARTVFGQVARWHGMDLEPGPGVEEVDVMGGAHWLSHQGGMDWDLVVSVEVFEHAAGWEQILFEAAGAVKSCGWMIVTCATHGRAPHSAVDGGAVRPDEYYGNVDPDAFQVAADLAGWHVEFLEIDKTFGMGRGNRGDLFALLRYCS